MSRYIFFIYTWDNFIHIDFLHRLHPNTIHTTEICISQKYIFLNKKHVFFVQPNGP